MGDLILNPEFIEVVEGSEPEEYFIGLYDHDGDPLYRASERLPMGMHHRDDET